MYCTKCGRTIEDGNRFCNYCGAPVEASLRQGVASQTAPVASAEPMIRYGGGTPPKDSRRQAKTVPIAVPIAIAAVAVIAIVAVVVVLLSRPGGNSAGSAGQAASSAPFEATTGGVSASGSEAQARPAEEGEAAPEATEQEAAGEAHAAQEPASEEADEDDESGYYILPDSDTRLYTTEELEQLSNWELFIARNEIYARHHRRFSSTTLTAYFEGCEWYEGYIDPQDWIDENMDQTLLNETERANAIAMLEIEKERGSEYL